MKHTKEPWSTGLEQMRLERTILNQDGLSIGNAINKWHASRIVACVNACAGLGNEDLKMVKEVKAMYQMLCTVTVAMDKIWSERTRKELTIDVINLLNRIEKGE